MTPSSGLHLIGFSDGGRGLGLVHYGLVIEVGIFFFFLYGCRFKFGSWWLGKVLM